MGILVIIAIALGLYLVLASKAAGPSPHQEIVEEWRKAFLAADNRVAVDALHNSAVIQYQNSIIDEPTYNAIYDIYLARTREVY